MKRSRINPVSKKRSEAIPERQELRRIQLSRKPHCEARIDNICQRRATDVHEVINRSQRSTAWLEPELFVSLCRSCHAMVTINPDFANRHGLHLSSWQFNEETMTLAAQIRGQCTNPACTVNHMEITSNG
jgi:hypothetical protein